MVLSLIPRTLFYIADNERKEISQAELLKRSCPLIVLGEAGMGKTKLMEWFAQQPGYSYCTARKLARSNKPESLLQEATVLVIDALDEVPAHQEKDAVDQILTKLEELGSPPFILSCRVAEWRSATATSAISTDYAEPPLQVHLNPLSRLDIEKFLTSQLGRSRSTEVLHHYEKLGLDDWLGNPQTLGMICSVSRDGPLPKTKSDLFFKTCKLLATEHSESKAEQQFSVETILDAAGAACAALLLCGQATIVRKSSAFVSNNELLLQDLHQLPDGAHIASALNTRIFTAVASDQFTCIHRRIAEYLAARWLTQLADTDRKRRRLVTTLQHQGLVPTSLRGLLAWLAQDPLLTTHIIQLDAISLLEYGDVDTLPLRQSRQLLQALQAIGEQNPRQLYLRSLTARCLTQPSMQPDVQDWLYNKDRRFIGLRLLIVESLEGTDMAQVMQSQLRAIIVNTEEFYAFRSAAFTAISALLDEGDATQLLVSLSSHADEDSLRLALEIAHHRGLDTVDAALLAKIALEYATVNSNMAGKFYFLEQYLPITQIATFLDAFVARIEPDIDRSMIHANDDATNLVFRLLVRVVMTSNAKAEQVLRWLAPFDEAGAYEDNRQQLGKVLQDNKDLRQAIQKLFVLTQSQHNAHHLTGYQIARYSHGLRFSESDVVALLNDLPLTYPHWKDAVQLAWHSTEHGIAARHAAQRFAHASPDKETWLNQLAAPRAPYDWEVEDIKRKRARENKRANQAAADLAWYQNHEESMIRGEWQCLWIPAAAYLGRHLFSEKAQKTAPEGRIALFLSLNLACAAHAGFEAYLSRSTPAPTARQVAQGLVKGETYKTRFIVAAAMLEKIRLGHSLSNLSDDWIMAGFAIMQTGEFHQHSGCDTTPLKTLLIDDLTRRGALIDAIRQFYEPQLASGSAHKPDLHGLMHDEQFDSFSTMLAIDWLGHFPNLHPSIEKQLIDRITRSQKFESLRQISHNRSMQSLESGRELLWLAVQLLTDFDETARLLDSQTTHSDLIWQLEERSLSNRHHKPAERFPWSEQQLAWIVHYFRRAWPLSGLSDRSGRDRAWDASEFILSLAGQLADRVNAEAIDELKKLRDAPFDSYTEKLQSLCSEQLRKCCEQSYRPISIEEFVAIGNDQAPKSTKQLQAWVLEELQVVQEKIRANDVDSWEGFYSQGVPLDEERCRNRLLELLRQGSREIRYDPESHVAADKEVDITCSIRNHQLPIEIKGQWHKQVWSAADAQLDRLYATDWRANGLGIYVVLWFGAQPEGKALKSPGRDIRAPRTSSEMRDMLIAKSVAAQSGRVAVVVLNVQAPTS